MNFQLKKLISFTLALYCSLGTVSCSNQPFNTPFNLQNNAPTDGGVSFRTASVPGQIIIKRKPGFKNISLVGAKPIKTIKKLNVDVIAIPASNSMADMLEKLRKNPAIEYAEPNYVRKVVRPRKGLKKTAAENKKQKKPLTLVNDPKRKDQFALDVIQAEKAWAINKGKEEIKIAIVDTGIDLTHPDLKEKVVPGFSTIKGNTNGKDDNGHGTHVAGIAAAAVNNGVGIAGLAANCKLMPIKVLDEFGSGDDAGIIEGIIWAVDNGAQIINMSLGGTGTSQFFEDAVKYALSKNVAVIAAMGNDGENVKNYPAASNGVIAVGSTDKSDNISGFSNFGDWVTLSAPGSEILSTVPTYPVDLNNYGFPQDYASLDGTSMATPYVSGLAALVLSKYGNLTPEQLKKKLIEGTDDLGPKGFDNHFGHGRINALKTLKN